jgi:twinkle protein
MVERKGELTIGDSWDELGIEIPPRKSHTDADIKIRECPGCEAAGKKFNDSSLSVNPVQGIGHCFKCGNKYAIRKERKTNVSDTPKYTPPSKENITKLSADGLKLFTDRMISQEAVVRHKIAERNGMVAFPYMYYGELVNIKYRGITDKKFSQSPGGMHVMYNHDNALEYMESSGDFRLIICEGEFDSLAFETAGIPFSLSVDSGAPNPNDKVEKKLECFTNSFDLFEMAETVYIATDNDENGKRLEQELIRRLPIEKVKLISFGKHKDANDYLRWEGREALADLLKHGKDVKIDGVFSAEDVEDRLWDMYRNGLPKGNTTHYPSIDRHWKWRSREVTVVTGYNNEGKSNLFINLAIIKSVVDDWKFAVFSPENFPPDEWFEDAIHTYIGKPTDVDYVNRADEHEYKKAVEFMKDKFYLVFPPERHTLDELFKRFDYLVRRYGIRSIIIDPYNQIDHLFERHETIDLYVSRFMSLLKRFAMTRDVSIILIAHQNPPKTKTADGNYPEPDSYTIKNGGTIPDKADNVVAVWRPMRRTDDSNPMVKFISYKIKKKKLVGRTGDCEIAYNWRSNRYLDRELGGNSPLDVKLSIMPEKQFTKAEQLSL